ncbi:GNAT family N-acetyltransferase [Paracoccus denitrificans]|uniref:GCN5-related N-acetyltransferase n=1 Tax=Paracoccus denitrificans (strain Pd 1222) TaxID=318586 RepID=A1B217_PARDP|nr:GNAT family N-acetyltransferase [Paracoccus denitrificans]ABL69561.1 GCN5-related N-acetyltransferase [Paracoccus denitrificans PD1222]MBB4626809.1 ribosomal protein S18 acetylase RimI-like enzyme [Paracoccus denitrificans]MCU7427708.1 GNAT family N-acetyltransferase [Paracoccus denitrificans]QAR24968.1 GNAT family N-acetyltransferase [Paracoccus denitrificans]UPV93853.1 GNAT family N-acetyltransferase [Paracoccus denitrificans]
MQEIEIRPIGSIDHDDWVALWRENLAYFNAGDAAVTAIPTIWQRLLTPDVPLAGWLILLRGHPAGLAHVVLRQHTFSSRPVGVLEDLWITSGARREGLGRAVVTHLAEEGRTQGWSRLEWETDEDNLAARSLYDALADPLPLKRYQIGFV